MRRYPRRVPARVRRLAIRIPPLVFSLFVAAAAVPAWAFSETHLDEISAPLAASVTARVAELEALPTRTSAEKRELSTLKRLAKTLGKSASKLAKDVNELAVGAKTVRKLGTAGAPFSDEVAEGLTRAAIALNEREDFLADHRAMIQSQSDLTKLDKAILKASAARQKAAAAADPADRAKLLKPAEAKLTAALKLAEKFARRTGNPLPPARLRSGDSVGPPGARVCVPRGSGTALEGAAVLIPSGALVAVHTVTITAIADFVGGRDVPAGPAVRFAPTGVALNQSATVFLPFSPPPGSTVDDVVIFRDDAGTSTALPGRSLAPGGTLTGTTATLGNFQAGVQAPPIGAPDGRYAVHGLAFISATGTTRAPNLPADAGFDPAVNASLLVQELRFRRDGTGTASMGSLSFLTRVFTAASPHHSDVSGFTATNYDFAWTRDADNRFSFSFPAPVSGTILVKGVASTDGRVLVLTGRGGTFDYCAVGLRPGEAVTTANLAGRWSATEFGVDHLDAGEEPFTTRWRSVARTMSIDDAGLVTFDASGTEFQTDVTYETDLTDPVHTLTSSSDADGGTLSLRVATTGAVTDANFSQSPVGFFSRDAGVLVLGTFSPASGRVALMIASPQGESVPPNAFEGTWNTVRFEAGSTIGIPDSRSSTYSFLGLTGTFTADVNLDATVADDGGTRAVYTLTGNALSTSWTLSSSTTSLPSGQAQFTVEPDPSGNHRPATGPVWYSVSSDSSVLLGTLTAADADSTVGFVVGVK